MKVDDDTQRHRLSRNYTEHWRTPATKNFSNAFTPFTKRVHTFQAATEPPLRSNKFMIIKEAQC